MSSRDPFAQDDPSGIRDWMQSKGHTVRAPTDPNNMWNRPLRRCRLPSCGAVTEHKQKSAVYCGRDHKTQHYDEIAAAKKLAETKDLPQTE
jgi:hypothetical protein